MRLRIFFSLVVATTLTAVGAHAQGAPTVTTDRANMDTTCSACTDFFGYANGGWLRTAQIPASKTSVGSFSLLSDRNEEAVHQILGDDASALHKAAAKPGTNPWKIGTFCANCMDTIGISARGIEPLRPALYAITAAGTTADLVRVFGATYRRTGIAPFAVSPSVDPKNSNETIVSAGQADSAFPSVSTT